MGLFKGIFTCLIKAPLSALYGTGIYFRNKLYDWGVFKTTSFKLPIINVGNITVGGTGKTPHTEYILSLLSEKYNMATLSRGYKRKSKGFQYVECSDTVDKAGDEPLQIKQKFPLITVSVDADRVAAIKRLISEKKDLQIILLDDAFQHRKVKAGVNIVLIDYNRPIHTDHLLPWGRLRDTKSQLKRGEIIIVTKCPSDLQPIDLRMISKHANIRAYQQLFFTTLVYGEKEAVFSDIENTNEFLDGEGTIAVAGIATPKVFLSYVEKNFGKTIPIIYPDHHNFTKADILHICKTAQNSAVVVTTEKDCMRLKQWADIISPEIKAKMFYIPIKVKFLKDEDKFINYIFNYVRTNKSNSRLY